MACCYSAIKDWLARLFFVMPPLDDVEKCLHCVCCGRVALGVKMRRADFSCSAVIAKGFLRDLFAFQFCSACFSGKPEFIPVVALSVCLLRVVSSL